MIKTCQNCNAPVQGNFCSNCGQATNTHKINLHYLWHDIQHGFFHVDKGILFTAKELFTRPGNTIREFLEGKRIKHFKPVSLIIILAGIYGFLSHYFNINMLFNDIKISGSGEKFNHVKDVVEKMSEWLSRHYSFFALIQIPLFSIGTYLSFKKVGYNFIEHIVINTFATSQRLILHIVTFPLYYIFNETSTLRTIAGLVDLIGYAFIFWALYQLFNSLTRSQRIWRILASFAISFLIMFLILIGIFEFVVRFA